MPLECELNRVRTTISDGPPISSDIRRELIQNLAAPYELMPMTVFLKQCTGVA